MDKKKVAFICVHNSCRSQLAEALGKQEQSQYSKTVDKIPAPDLAISMGCDVGCPYIGRDFDEEWGLADPTGKSDECFVQVIEEIIRRIREL